MGVYLRYSYIYLPWDASKDDMQGSIYVVSEFVIIWKMSQPRVGRGIGVPVIPERRVLIHGLL